MTTNEPAGSSVDVAAIRARTEAEIRGDLDEWVYGLLSYAVTHRQDRCPGPAGDVYLEHTASEEPAAVVTFDGEPIEKLIPSEVARCEHGWASRHDHFRCNQDGERETFHCPGPAASGAPDGQR